MKILSECNLATVVVDILDGQTIVFPTETSYGLGCDAFNQTAVDKIFKIKGRDFNKPLLVVVSSVSEAKKYLVWNEKLEEIAGNYWPGPVTVVGEYRRDPTPALPSAEGRGFEFQFQRIHGYVSSLIRRRELRKNLTKAEIIIWNSLKDKRLNGIKFRRQHGIGSYIVDFFQPDAKLVIELDGDVHYIDSDQVEKDKYRTKWLEESGYQVIRFDNFQVYNNLDAVLCDIKNATAKPHPRPPLCGREGNRWPPSSAEEGVGGGLVIRKEGVGGGLATGVVSRDNTLAVRVSADFFLKSLTQKIQRPLVATSANLAGAGEIYSASEAAKMFANKNEQPDLILDYGILPHHKPTTVVSVVGNKLKILRQGEVKVL